VLQPSGSMRLMKMGSNLVIPEETFGDIAAVKAKSTFLDRDR
jgi:hypothetical protein